MTPLFDNPIRMVREMKGTPLSIIIALGLVHQRVSQEWLERSTGYTDKPISQALQYLREVGLVDQTSSGWQLIKENVNQFPLVLQRNDVEEDVTEEPAASLCSRDPKVPSENQIDDVQLSRNNSDSVKLEVVNPNIINTSSSISLNLSSQDGKIPPRCENADEIRQVLDAAADLFTHEIVGDPCDYADVDRLISWIAQAYNSHGKVKSPAGLVYWAFHQGKDRSPEKKYLYYPDQYLPESFLRASGQYIFDE
jgi:hypothetical protein